MHEAQRRRGQRPPLLVPYSPWWTGRFCAQTLARLSRGMKSRAAGRRQGRRGPREDRDGRLGGTRSPARRVASAGNASSAEGGHKRRVVFAVQPWDGDRGDRYRAWGTIRVCRPLQGHLPAGVCGLPCNAAARREGRGRGRRRHRWLSCGPSVAFAVVWRRPGSR